jgi:L-alanine-DL-glutamate epimerase-like enolase superfamily enzyme
MKIASITALIVKVPIEESFGGAGIGDPVSSYTLQKGWRGLYAKQTECLLVKIETDDGIIGYGEGQAPIAPEVGAAIINKVLRPILIGRDPDAVGVLRHEMYNAMNIRGHYGGFMLHAISAVDIALWDIKGKKLKSPVASLLGGAFCDRIPVYVSGIRGSSLDEKAETARRLLDAGFRNFKMFLGFGLEEDLEHVRRIGEVIRPHGRLMVDVLWNYDVSSAIRLGRELEHAGAVWLEAPVSPEDVAGHAEVCRALDMPVATGETEVTRYQFLRWFEARALDIAQPDVARCGITETRKIADLAETFNIMVALHCGVILAPGIAASIHVAAATPNLLFLEYQPLMLEIANRFLRRPLRCENGLLHLPDGSGLGIDLNEEVLVEYSTSLG